MYGILCKRFLNLKSIQVVLVPSHFGLQENERADYLANTVANKSVFVQQQEIPVM